jgi:hypothetical protein
MLFMQVHGGAMGFRLSSGPSFDAMCSCQAHHDLLFSHPAARSCSLLSTRSPWSRARLCYTSILEEAFNSTSKDLL